MTEPLQDNTTPHIAIVRGPHGAAIRQHRPAVLSTLSGMALPDALKLIPTLLPVCGEAQSIAAERAAEAARGEEPLAATEAEREARLWREQSLSAGWRLAIDWPNLLGTERPMAWLKMLRHSETNAACAAVLNNALPQLDAVRTGEDLADWGMGGSGIAHGVVREALRIAKGPESGVPLTETALADNARELMRQPAFNPLAPAEQPIEVGPLAMAREPLIKEIQNHWGATATGRLLASVADCRAIVRGLRSQAATDEVCISPQSGPGGPGREAGREAGRNAWSEGESCGTGRAITARGPVFHQVTLDEDQQVAHWRALAPTDWHFSPSGPLASALAWPSGEAEAKLLIASFDPCAPWTLHWHGQD